MRRHCLCTDDGGGPENENRAVFFGFTVGTGKTRNSKRQMAISNLGGIYGKRNQLPGCLPCLLSHDTTNIPPRKGQLYYVKAGDCITLEFCNQGYRVYSLIQIIPHQHGLRQMAISNLGGIYGKRNQLPGCLPCLPTSPHEKTNGIMSRQASV